MKRKFFAFIFLLAAGLSLSSCLSNDDDTNVEYAHDTAITAFSLGSMDKYAKTSAGKDTLLRGEVAGAGYKFTIDQANHKIYNEDSLPFKTRTEAVLATVAGLNSSYIQWKYKNQENEDSLVWYSSTDSVNLDKQSGLRIYAQDATVYADYTLTVNVHTQDGDVFAWKSFNRNADLASLDSIKAVALDGKVCVFGKTAGGKTYAYITSDGDSWEKIGEFGKEACQNVASMDGNLYVLDSGKVYFSSGTANWMQVAEDESLKQLLGASSKYLYARTTNGIAVSADKGVTWNEEKLDAVADSLPTHSISLNGINILSTKDAENLLLLGTHQSAHGDTIAVSWNRTVDYKASATDGQWNYVEYDANQSGKLPYLAQITAVAASDSLLALGSNGVWYKSINTGLSWSKDTLMSSPSGFDATQSFALTREKEQLTSKDGVQYDSYSFWLISNGYVWKGRYVRDTWLRKE